MYLYGAMYFKLVGLRHNFNQINQMLKMENNFLKRVGMLLWLKDIIAQDKQLFTSNFRINGRQYRLDIF